MSEATRLSFGTSARQQIGARIRAYVAKEFGNNVAKAAKSLGLSRQRLFSYTTAKALPREEVFDRMLKEWGLDILGGSPRHDAQKLGIARARQPPPAQRLLFES